MKLKLNNVRLAFPVLFEAKTVNGEGKPAFSASFLMDPADPQVKALNQAIEQVAKDKWGAKADAILKQMRDDEVRHGQQARDAGGVTLPAPVRGLMKLTGRIMTTTARVI